MPLVHRLSGTGFASDEGKSTRVRERPATYPGAIPLAPLPQAPDSSGGAAFCPLCATRASTFDLSMRCCLDRYEAMFGSVTEHRSMFLHARDCALEGDFMPARRLVESYRRVFGPMAAVELKRRLWQAIAEAQTQPRQRAEGGPRQEPHAIA
jgi:hypothetical protein